VKNRNLSSSIISAHRGYGTHFVTVSVGTPPQPLRLAVALGSDYTSFPCQNCKSCQEPHFRYSADSVHNCSAADCVYSHSSCDKAGEGKCEITVNYQGHLDIEGTDYKGIEIIDNVNIQNSLGDFPLKFICQEENFGLTEQLGAGYLSMSTDDMSFVNQLFDAKKIAKRMFSLCFRKFDDYQPHGVSAGHVTFGHVDRGLLSSPLVYANNYATPNSFGSYAVRVRRVYMARGNDPTILEDFSSGALSALPIGLVGDTGSSNASNVEVDYSHMNGEEGDLAIQTNQPTTYLHSGIEEAFRSTFKTFTGVDYTNPFFELEEEKLADLPTIFLQFEHSRSGGEIFTDSIPGFVGRSHDPENYLDVVIAIPPKSYISYLDGKAYPILHFGPYPRLAANVFQNYEVVFDIARKRIGFAKRDKCPEGVSIVGKNDQQHGRNDNLSEDVRGIKVAEDHDFVTISQNLNAAIEAADENEIIPGAMEQIEHDEEITSVGGNGISGELDGYGASQMMENNEKNSALGKTRRPGRLPELMDGLPKPSGGFSSDALRIGPGAVAAAEALRHKNSKGTAEEVYSFWNLIGFSLFFSAFFLTAYFTRDSVQDPQLATGIKNSHLLEDDTDKANEAWGRSHSYYNDGTSMKNQLNSVNANVYNGGTYPASSNGTYSAPSNENRYASGYENSSFSVNKAGTHASTSGSSIYDSGEQGGSDYDRPSFYGERQKSLQSISTQETGASSVVSDTSKSLNPKKEWQKPFYEQFHQSASTCGNSTSDDDSFHYPQKADPSKFVKPVNADRSMFARSNSPSNSSRAQSIESTSREFVIGSGSGRTASSSEYDDVVKPLQSSRPAFDYDEEMTMDSHGRGCDDPSQTSRGVESQYGGSEFSEIDDDELTMDTYGSRGYDDLGKPLQSEDDYSNGDYDDVRKPSQPHEYMQSSDGDDYSVPTVDSYESSEYDLVKKPPQQTIPSQQQYADDYSNDMGSYLGGNSYVQ